MGVVYGAFDTKLERAVVVKTLAGDSLDPSGRARLLREARALAQLDHPGICRIYDVIEDGSERLLVLELIDGERLDQSDIPHRDLSERLRVLAEIAEAIAAAHTLGIVHRDLKPANVLIDRSGRARVTDLGIARWTPVDQSVNSDTATT